MDEVVNYQRRLHCLLGDNINCIYNPRQVTENCEQQTDPELRLQKNHR